MFLSPTLSVTIPLGFNSAGSPVASGFRKIYKYGSFFLCARGNGVERGRFGS